MEPSPEAIKGQIERLDGELDDRIKASPIWQHKADLLTSVKGVGDQTARALIADPRILVLDEATSNVDLHTEGRIEQGLRRLLHGRTAIVIAHRLSTIVAADRILVLDGGRIVEEGRHDELLRHGRLYADLYRTQLERAAEPA